MVKVALFLLVCAGFICARENPFEMTESPATIGKTTETEKKQILFENTTLKLPSSARILKSVTITFQNLDGSISEEIQSIDKDIDWHLPLVLQSQQKPSHSLPTAPSVKADVKKVDKVEQTIASPKTIEQNSSSEKLALGEKIFLEIQGKEILIDTKDTKVRDFLVSEPYKIVVDFQKTSSFATKTLLLNKLPFISATLGNHDGFYRIAIALDGQYRYSIEKSERGYRITLK